MRVAGGSPPHLCWRALIPKGRPDPGATAQVGPPASTRKAKQPGLSLTMGSHTDLLGHGQALRNGDEISFFSSTKLLDRIFIVPQVKFRPHQDDGCVGTVVSRLRYH